MENDFECNRCGAKFFHPVALQFHVKNCDKENPPAWFSLALIFLFALFVYIIITALEIPL